MFDSIKREINKRKNEKEEMKAAIQNERERIAEKRANARKNILRKKVDFVDKVSTSLEKKKDARDIASFEANQEKKLTKARAERRNEFVKRNKVKLSVGTLVVCGALCGGGMIVGHVQEQNAVDEYNLAVNQVVEEKYEAAVKTIEEIGDSADGIEGTGDIKSIGKYSKIQASISSYAGEPDKFLEELKKANGIGNKEVQNQQKHAIEQAETADSIQQKINKIDLTSVTQDSRETLNSITKSISSLDGRYASLIDVEKLTEVEGIIAHIETDDTVGKVITAINKIGSVTLDSENAIIDARNAYNALTENEKNEVANSGKLTDAEKKLTSLKEEEKRAEEEAKKEAEEKEKEEAENAVAQRSIPDNNDYTVYITRTGNKYHSANCRFGDIPISKSEAQSRRFAPCNLCHP